MANPFSGINMMSYALRNFQQALQTSGHNVSNVDTRGYSRQRVEFATNQPKLYYESGWRSMGQGAHVAAVSRARDLFLERSANQSAGNLGKFGMSASGLGVIEQVYGEPSDSGISAALDKFFDSWSGLAANPGDAGAKFEVRNAGQTLADRIRGSWGQFDRVQTDATGRIQTVIGQINDLAGQIDRLNKAIKQATVGGNEPSDLLDQRDQAVRDLSGLVDVQTERFTDGTLAVYASGFTVVDAAGTMPYPSTYDVATGTVTDGTTTNPVRNGQLAGLFVQASEALNQKSRLDTLANTLRTEINAVHTTGTNAAGTTNVKFFNDVAVPPQTGAIDFDLDDPVKADVNNVMSGVSGNAGDGGLAQTLSGIRDSGFAALGTKSFSGYFQQTVDTLASVRAYYIQAQDTEVVVNDQVQAQIQAVSGVSIDDEMADMVKFQRSYQAAAKTLTIFDQVTQDVINMVNR
ncbi:MAG: flagellar hook-associated protein FlgK [Armatimonadetes bacterium]|nr:flagellar hook-associated protein FlgK [Armatimonadota bacterium]